MKKVVGIACGALVVLALQSPAGAVDFRLGAQVDYGTKSAFGIGPRLELALEDVIPGLRFAVDYNKFFDHEVYNDVDGLSVESNTWHAGLHVLYEFSTLPIAEGANLYAGAGVIYAKRTFKHGLEPPTAIANDAAGKDDLYRRYTKLGSLQADEDYTDKKGVGFSVIVGSTFKTGWTVIPFVEARYTSGVNEVVGSAGLLFSTGSESAKSR